MAGIDSRKENLKAFSRLIPSRSATAIVAPLLEMPGIMAMPSAMPINVAVKMLMLSVCSLLVFVA